MGVSCVLYKHQKYFQTIVDIHKEKIRELNLNVTGVKEQMRSDIK